ncbi:major histocompatibility complex class I-related gene protein-like [Eublepharis macularius]|uniref:Major histocompatibility complex class I-related gene protein-like n=1 Tax=Eublepharis macularius TaxID=481883 RepID=A0AA97J8M0_EUBMA|nr:major histocompatibility complex class I-related gene protein-like [Eublepharis macularius]
MATWEPGWWVPRFSALVYMDDQLIGRYDRETELCLPQSPWIEKIGKDDAHFWTRNTEWDFASTSLVDLMVLKNLYNQSRGLQTLQVIFGCELRGDNRTQGFVTYGYNGRDFLSLNQESLTWTAISEDNKLIKRKWDAERNRQQFWKYFLEVTCVEGLHTYLRYGKEVLLRTEPPMVTVRCKAGYGGLDSLICHARGFYPREIDATWMKDGDVWEQDTFHGGIFPNSDGTYYTWLSVEVHSQDRESFWCHVEHEGLQGPLDLAMGKHVSSSGSRVSLTGADLMGATASAILLGTGALF